MAQHVANSIILNGQVTIRDGKFYLDNKKLHSRKLDPITDKQEIKVYNHYKRAKGQCDKCGIWSYLNDWGTLVPIGGLNKYKIPRVGGVCGICITPRTTIDWNNDVFGIKYPILGSIAGAVWDKKEPVSFTQLPNTLQDAFGTEKQYLEEWHKLDAEDRGIDYLDDSGENDNDDNVANSHNNSNANNDYNKNKSTEEKSD